MMDVNLLRSSTAAVNYTQAVRSTGQRLVKQEILGVPNDALMEELTELLQELKNGGTTYGIVPLRNVAYQSSLTILTRYWDTLRDEIQIVRAQGADNSEILPISEQFDSLAETSVTCAQTYLTEISNDLQSIEYAMASCGVLLILVMLFNIIQNRRLSSVNVELSHTAYLDKHTELPNKSRCEELLNAPGELDLATACVMFDLNNLKKVNDAMGHQAGDNMIRGFARLLRKATPSADFVGRYGGDEFVVILTDTTPGDVDAYLEKLERMTAEYNRSGTQFMSIIPLSYAAGFAHSAQHPHSTMATLLKAADENMYRNKAAMKAAAKLAQNRNATPP